MADLSTLRGLLQVIENLQFTRRAASPVETGEGQETLDDDDGLVGVFDSLPDSTLQAMRLKLCRAGLAELDALIERASRP